MSERHPRRSLRRGGLVLLALLGIALLRTDRSVEAALPGELARVTPSGALVLLETDDLPALVGRWRDCQLRQDVESTDVYQRCQSSRLILRLGERRDLLEAVLANPLTLEWLANLPGDRGGIALYDVSETAFVAWVRTHRGAGEELALLRPDLASRQAEMGGQRYLVHEGSDHSSPVAFAVVGDLLIVSNDLPNFERALSLASAQGGEALADDGAYQALARGAPVSAQVHLYLDMGRLVETRQFRRYWVHHNAEELRGLDRALLSLTFSQDRTVEHRLLSYREGATRMAAGAAGAIADERLSALPRGVYSSLRQADAREAASAARWIWPAGEAEVRQLEALFARGQVRQVVEILRPRLDRDGFNPQDQLALALSLAAPDALTTDEVLQAGAAALARSVGAGEEHRPISRRSHVRGVTVQTLGALMPGLSDLSVARSVDGAVLVIGNTAAVVAEVAAAAAPTAPLGRMLTAGGADVSQVDFTQARRLLSQRLSLITTTGGRERYGEAALLGEDVPELLRVPGLSRIERVALREGDLDRQIVRYLHAR